MTVSSWEQFEAGRLHSVSQLFIININRSSGWILNIYHSREWWMSACLPAAWCHNECSSGISTYGQLSVYSSECERVVTCFFIFENCSVTRTLLHFDINKTRSDPIRPVAAIQNITSDAHRQWADEFNGQWIAQVKVCLHLGSKEFEGDWERETSQNQSWLND